MSGGLIQRDEKVTDIKVRMKEVMERFGKKVVVGQYFVMECYFGTRSVVSGCNIDQWIIIDVIRGVHGFMPTLLLVQHFCPPRN